MQHLKDSEETRARYAGLVASSPDASVYHTLEWLSVFESLSCDLEFVDTGETIVPFVCKGKGPLRRGFSLPYDTYGGAVAGSGHISYDRVLESLQIPSARIVDFAARTNGTNCRVETATTHIVPLQEGYEAVAGSYAQMNRRAIRQAKRRGLIVRTIEREADVGLFHQFYMESCARYGSPPLPRSFFETVHRIMVPKGLARFYLAWHGDRAVAGNLVLRYRGRAYDWTWGYDRTFQHLRPTNALIDTAIRDEIELGSTEFNLGASPVDNNGNAQFKENFGAKAYTYPILSKAGFYYSAARKIKYGGWLGGRILRRR